MDDLVGAGKGVKSRLKNMGKGEGEGGCVRKKRCGVDWVSNQELISLRWTLFLVRFTIIV